MSAIHSFDSLPYNLVPPKEKPSLINNTSDTPDTTQDVEKFPPLVCVEDHGISVISIHPVDKDAIPSRAYLPREKPMPPNFPHVDEKVRTFLEKQAALLASKGSTPKSIPPNVSAQPSTNTSQSELSVLGDEESSLGSGAATPAIPHFPAHTVSGLKQNSDYHYVDYFTLRPTTLDSLASTAPGTPDGGSIVEFSSHRSVNLEALTHSETDVVIKQFREQEPTTTRDLIVPVQPLPVYLPPGREPSLSNEELYSPETSAAVVQDVRVPSSLPKDDTEPLRWWKSSFWRKPSSDIAPTIAVAADQCTIILPSPPTQFEKTIYAQTRRLPLYLFGTMSFLSVSTGMWFFSLSSKMFYWFGAFVGLIQVYLIISYMVGYLGKDFNVEEHQKILEEHSYPTDKAPSVDIYLPCCHEPLEVLENTYKYVAKLNYPNFKVYVLDDGGLETVNRLAEAYCFEYITRNNKPHLKKAGNLRHAFARTEGDFFVIFDADFCPCEDFLGEVLPYMNKYPDVAIVQSPQFFRPSSEQTWVEQGASATQELFYRIVQVNRDRWGASICVGSNAIYRRAALVEVGGTAEIGHSEDVHTGFYALTRGWKLKYIPLALACGVSPDTARAFFSQQMRWCSGSTTLLTNPDFWKSDLTTVQKVCYLSGMMYYTAAAFMIFLASLPGLMMIWLNPDMIMWYNFAYAFPSLIYSVFVFRLWSRQRYNFNVNFVFVIQQFAYLMAIKDRIFGTTASWVPSGDNKSHLTGKKKKGGNNKYRNMRILCGIWMFGSAVALIVGVTLRIIEGHNWWNFLALILLDTFNLFISHKFIFYSK